ncbi:MAG: DUF1904 family protein [Erysipelotrichia bacterium]|nr:DUF1904 family protein [Erysipelotrichia bacterium]
MITITINGLDQFVVARLSKELNKNLANLFEVDEKEINFIAPQSMVFHNGVEQTSWHVIIDVAAPEELKKLEKNIADFLFSKIEDLAINIEIKFTYFSKANHFKHVNEDYPLYITEANVVHIEDETDEEESEEEDAFLEDPLNILKEVL